MAGKETRRGAPDARWWTTEGEEIRCGLCPRRCRIAEGKAGFCRVRRNVEGRLRSEVYGRPAGFAVDPIEKKPLYHFLPGSEVFSFGTLGCTLDCRFCQNWDLARAERPRPEEEIPPEKLVEIARRSGCPSIAYTYNEPVVFGEYAADCAAEARRLGIRNVFVTNGYVTPDAREAIFRDGDGANVDLKGFTEEFYRERTGGSLAPVLDTLLWMRRETSIWLEVTTLLIPGLNDGEEEIRREAAWIAGHLGEETPLHLSAFHPAHRMTDRPRTPAATVRAARAAAIDEGLRFVYTGNLPDREGSTTFCPACGEPLLERSGHEVPPDPIPEGRCAACGALIAGVFR